MIPARSSSQKKPGERLDLIVSRGCELSRAQAATLIANGSVTVEVRPRKRRIAVRWTRSSCGMPPPPGRDVIAESIPLSVAYEDDSILVIDKAAGMVVHPAPGNWTGTLVNALMGRGDSLAEGGGAQRAGLVHH